MKILGYEKVKFNFDDGRSCEGYYIYLHDDSANPNKVIGMKTERVFISDTKASACNFNPKVGNTVKVLYNKYGKVDEITTQRAIS